MPLRYKVLIASIVAYQAALTYALFDMTSALSNWIRVSQNIPPASLLENSVGFSNAVLLGGAALVFVVANVIAFAISGSAPKADDARKPPA